MLEKLVDGISAFQKEIFPEYASWFQALAGGPRPGVVASHAVAPEHPAMLGCRIRRRNGLLDRRIRRRAGPGGNGCRPVPDGEQADGYEPKQATYGQVWSHGRPARAREIPVQRLSSKGALS